MSRGYICAILLALLSSCATPPAQDPRASQMAQFFSRVLLPLARSRPHQLQLRLDEMALSPFRFLRGSEILFTRDFRDATLPFARTTLPGSFQVLLQGDAHLENIGTFSQKIFDLNDFDASGFGPPWWEVRRAAASVLIALRESGRTDLNEADITRSLAASYTQAILDGEVAPLTGQEVGAVFQKRLTSASKDGPARDELKTYTELVDGRRKLKRGGTDPEDPREALIDAPPAVTEALPEMLRGYRSTLFQDPFSPTYFTLKDAARRCGQGVGSLTAVRFYVLIEGPSEATEDDVLLQVKESSDSSLDSDLPYGSPAASPAARTVDRQRRLQSIPEADPHLGHGRLLDLPVLVLTISDYQKTVRTGDLEGRSAEEVRRFAEDFGRLLGRTHARGLTPQNERALPALQGWLRGREETFLAETAASAGAYADQVIEDHRRFLALRAELGPLLGLQTQAPNDTPHDPAPRAVLDPPCP